MVSWEAQEILSCISKAYLHWLHGLIVFIYLKSIKNIRSRVLLFPLKKQNKLASWWIGRIRSSSVSAANYAGDMGTCPAGVEDGEVDVGVGTTGSSRARG